MQAHINVNSLRFKTNCFPAVNVSSFAFMCYSHVNYIFWVAYDRIFMYNQSC